MMSDPATEATNSSQSYLHQALARIGASAVLHNILVIGSSSGGVWLDVLVEALTQNPARPRLFYLENNPERFSVLSQKYRDHEQVVCLLAASLAAENLVTAEEVQQWAESQSYPIDLASWQQGLAEEKGRLGAGLIPLHGLQQIRQKFGLQHFEMVLVDGSPFTGRAEMEEVRGSDYLVLMDAVGLRNFQNVKRLMNEPGYRLVEGSTTPASGYAIFHKASERLPVEFFTIVLNGLPFLPEQLEIFRQLSIPWRWHIIEGVARHVHDTAWSLQNGGEITGDFHRQGLSKDGTSEWIDSAAAQHPGKILVYRPAPGTFWEGKLAMVRAPLASLTEECLLWQIDADEFWTPAQIEKVHRLFQADARRTAAYFFCDFYVGPHLVSISPHTYANNLHQDWLRAWRYRPGMAWTAHEPPTLVEKLLDGQTIDLGKNFPFTHYETAREGLIFRHLAYVQEEQLAFKEKYYGYKGAVEAWKKLQQHDKFPVNLGDFFPWVKDQTRIDQETNSSLSSFFREQRQAAVAAPASGQSRIVIDGVFYQFNPESGIARVWTCLLRKWAHTEFGRRLVVIDREYSAPRVEGITYLPLQAHNYGNLVQDQRRIEAICLFYQAALFISTYYSRPLTTPSLMMAYDFIPEIFIRDSLHSEPMWAEKVQAVEQASAFLCISENTQQDLARLYPVTQLYPVRYTHLASDYRRQGSAEQAEFRWKYKLHRPFWLLVGARRSYKNADLFFAALRQFSSRGGFDVVCTGARELEVFEGMDINIRKLRLDDHDLQCAYSAAEALIYPSLYEGFGLPILEAMSCGCPVITCKISSIPEAAGEAAIYVHPKQPEELVEAMSRVQWVPVREKLIEAGYQQAAKFTWESAADNSEQFISAVAAALPRPSGEIPANLVDQAPLLRGFSTLDQLLHRGPGNPRVARNLIERLKQEYGPIPRLAYFEKLLAD